jgi:hypothetical protein
VGLRALASSQNELGLFGPTSRGELSRSRSGYDRDRYEPAHLPSNPNTLFQGGATFLFPWFWRECRRIHFGRASRGGARRANPPRCSRPSSLLRKERARCSGSNAAIDESKRALASSPMRPVRPGGTSTTDSSCPSAVAPSKIRMGPRLGNACLAPLRVERDGTNDSFERCHAPDLVTEE